MLAGIRACGYRLRMESAVIRLGVVAAALAGSIGCRCGQRALDDDTLTVTPMALVFGVGADDPDVQTITIASARDHDSPIELSGFDAPSDAVVPARGTVELEVHRPYPSAGDDYWLDELELRDDNGHEETRIPIVGYAAPRIQVWPEVVDFGDADGPYSAELTFTNRGSAGVALGGDQPPLRLEYTDYDVDPRQTVTVVVHWDGTLPDHSAFDVQIAGVDVTLRAHDCENGIPAAYDTDGDGFTTCGGDTDDGDPAVHPACAPATEDPTNRVDDDCNGIIDDGAPWTDDDGDGLTETQGDCDDDDPAARPGLADEPGGVDVDCDGSESDADGDGVDAPEDCDDENALSYPGNPYDIPCDSIDEDCDGADAIDVSCGWHEFGYGCH
jgi:hypothetical protein